MGLLAIVEDYLHAAMKQAVYEELPGGGVGGTVPGFTGLVAIGDDKEDCAIELRKRLMHSIQLYLERSHPSPVFGDLDLNPERNEVLASFHDHNPSLRTREFFPNTEAFEEYLESLPYAP